MVFALSQRAGTILLKMLQIQGAIDQATPQMRHFQQNHLL